MPQIEDGKLISKIQKKGWCYILIVTIIEIIMILISVIYDTNGGKINDIYHWGWCLINKFSKSKVINICNIENVIKCLDEFCNMVVTYNTILTAAVIFFYSTLENKRGGIAQRTIIAYGYGSKVIPALFFETLVATPFIYIVKGMNLYLTTWVLLFYTFWLQLTIIYIILISASFAGCIRIICYVELKQYEEMKINNDKYIWIYLSRHLERAIKSDELVNDKLRFVRAIIWTPFKKRSLFKRTKVQISKLKTEDLSCVYHFYYDNLNAAFYYLKDEKKQQECQSIYEVLYEFLDNLRMGYESLETVKKNRLFAIKYNKKCKDCKEEVYQMVISGIMNAVLSNELEHGEEFCGYILNHLMTSQKKFESKSADNYDRFNILNRQVTLFLLFYEVLYSIDIVPSIIKNSGLSFPNINFIYNWKNPQPEEVGFYARFWCIWMEEYSLSKEKSMEHFQRAYDTLIGYSNSSKVIFNLIFRIEQMKRRDLI